ncbi:tumor necrosis factor receptor superfamily member 6 [Lates calcarifer]|uniref:Tumor necrosis factor receptor superfamily member 6 n=1 Tax=Lates calcarifer TaxID=8187 RepID=A0AAJ7PTJ8_LATCA|nr:tumor necrosis factor receptor superfamily member 6 [Lates calcarifer]
MRPLCYIAFTLLCSLSFLSSEPSIQCNKTQYAWPLDAPKFCCDKCPPGKSMETRPLDSCKIKCEPCEGDRYINFHNVELNCKICTNCNKTNMEYKSPCNATHDAVCRCKPGYGCTDQSCTQCVPIPDTTPPSTPTSTTPQAPTEPIKDTMWFLVIIALLCAVCALVVVTKIKPFLHWIRSKLAEKPALTPSYSGDDDVSKPVQEVCGKCDQLIDI